MDINQRHKTLYVCGAPKDDSNPSPCLIRYVLNDKGHWGMGGAAEKKSCKIFTSVKALKADKELIITGETDKVREGVGFVRLYDYNQNTVFDNIQPFQSYDEHKDIVTSLAVHPTADEMFFSGSRDHAIKMWDRRSKKSAGDLSEGRIICMF
jgi:WD40 repeat protein